ncbi:MAG: transglutaminase-like domain-containing protein [Lentisphaerota bacterium]
MMGWLVRYEAFPELFSGKNTGYGDLLSDGPLIADSWMKILIHGIHVGYSHSQVDINENDPSGRYRMDNQTLLNMNVLGSVQRISVNSSAALDTLYNLQRFSFAMSSGGYQLQLQAQRAGETSFDVTIRSPGGLQKARIEIPRDAILYSPLMETALKNLKPGQEMSMKVFDPTSMSTSDLIVKGVRREILNVDGKETETTLLAYDYGGMQVQSWISRDGTMVRQETPMGWTMEAASPDKAVDFSRNAASPDILKSMAIPVTGIKAVPSQCTRLQVALSGADFSSLELESHRQIVVDKKPARIILEILPDQLPDSPATATAPPANLPGLLKATMYVQSDHPEIIKRARSITAKATNDLEKALAIYTWVFQNVAKNPTVSLPSALDVLHTMKGDCNEHTYLFTALARAAGLPAQIRIGVVYMRGSFYYHAWPSVFVGRWLEMDPTLGQPAVDAGHLAFLSGELTEQMKLLGLLGKAQAEFLEKEP